MLKELKVTGQKVKEFQSDNGDEFDNPKVKDILNTEGVTQRLTMPYNPKQNLTERGIRTAVNMTRSIMHAHYKIR